MPKTLEAAPQPWCVINMDTALELLKYSFFTLLGLNIGLYLGRRHAKKMYDLGIAKGIETAVIRQQGKGWMV